MEKSSTLCPYCNEPFVPNTKRQAYCNDVCRTGYHNELKRQRRIEGGVAFRVKNTERDIPTDVATKSDIDAIRQQLYALTDLLLQQGATPIPNGQKPFEQKQLIPRKEDDLEDFNLEVKQSGRDEDNISSWNFMISAALQVYGNVNGLTDEIISYGLRTHRCCMEHVTRKSFKTDGTNKNKPKSKSDNDNDPKAMDVPQFDAPTFEEIDLDDWNL